ncbi:MAG: hypothetical protein QOG28_1360, partial [Trebonia sp.]|nr:hypothetical protein [Trebonia sp.]
SGQTTKSASAAEHLSATANVNTATHIDRHGSRGGSMRVPCADPAATNWDHYGKRGDMGGRPE